MDIAKAFEVAFNRKKDPNKIKKGFLCYNLRKLCIFAACYER